MRQSTDTASNGTSRRQVSCLKRAVKQNYIEKQAYTYRGLVTENELDSRVAVNHRCFSERGDSIISGFSWEPLRAKLQDN